MTQNFFLQSELIKKTPETGRSMVEMLGVLAIMGVLSLVAVQGFKTAISRYQANNIIENANIVRQTIIQAVSIGRHNFVLEYPYSSGFLVSGKYPFHTGCGYDDSKTPLCLTQDGHYIFIDEIQDGVCNALVSMTDVMTDLAFYKVNNITSGECNSGQNSVALFYTESENAQLCEDSYYDSASKACLHDEGDKLCTAHEETGVRMRLLDDFTIADDGMSASVSCGIYYEIAGKANVSFEVPIEGISGWLSPISTPEEFGDLGGWAWIKEYCYEGLKDSWAISGLTSDGWFADSVDKLNFSNTNTTDPFVYYNTCRDK